MFVFENFFFGYDGVSKKIINYHLCESFETAKKAAEEYIKRFFPEQEYKITKEESDNTLVYTLERKVNIGQAKDIEYVYIHEQKPKTYEDFIKVFDMYQDNIEKRHREVLGIDEYQFEITRE